MGILLHLSTREGPSSAAASSSSPLLNEKCSKGKPEVKKRSRGDFPNNNDNNNNSVFNGLKDDDDDYDDHGGSELTSSSPVSGLYPLVD